MQPCCSTTPRCRDTRQSASNANRAHTPSQSPVPAMSGAISNIEVRAGERLPLTVELEPSPDTGFELTSEPPGGLVWLDGGPVRGAAGQQVRSDFRAFRITPGHHVLEIKGEDRFKPWREDVEITPGQIQKVHALLIPAASPKVVRRKARNLESAPRPPIADADCTITVNTVPWSVVWIDGKDTALHTPFVDYKLPCGTHKLGFKRDDMQIDHVETINLRAGQPFKQRYTLATDE